MSIIVILLTILFGCAIGFGLACLFMSLLVLKSNNHGDSKNTFKNYAFQPVKITARADKVEQKHLADMKQHMAARHKSQMPQNGVENDL